jgi:hypothetical protein
MAQKLRIVQKNKFSTPRKVDTGDQKGMSYGFVELSNGDVRHILNPDFNWSRNYFIAHSMDRQKVARELVAVAKELMAAPRTDEGALDSAISDLEKLAKKGFQGAKDLDTYNNKKKAYAQALEKAAKRVLQLTPSRMGPVKSAAKQVLKWVKSHGMEATSEFVWNLGGIQSGGHRTDYAAVPIVVQRAEYMRKMFDAKKRAAARTSAKKAPASVMKEIMDAYNENRAKWIEKHDSDKGFDAWFTKQALKAKVAREMVARKFWFPSADHYIVVEYSEPYRDDPESVYIHASEVNIEDGKDVDKLIAELKKVRKQMSS